MGFAGYAWRRARASAAPLSVLLLMTMLVVVAIAGTTTFLDAGATTAVRAALDDVPAAARTVQLQTRLAEDRRAQTDGAERVIDERLPAARDRWTTVRTPPLATERDDVDLVLLVDPTAAGDLVVDGSLPTATDEGALQADAAQALGVGVGDVLDIVSDDTVTPLRLVGTWRAADAQASRWGGDPSVEGGRDPEAANTFGPLLVTQSTVDGLDVVPFVRWTLSPGPAVAPADLVGWERGLAGLREAFDDAGVVERGITLTGSLASTVADVRERLVAVRAAGAIPLVVVAVVSLVAVRQVAGLLAATRDRETFVLRARGASRAQAVGLAAAEAALALVAAAIGALVVVALWGGSPGTSARDPVLVAAATGASVAALMTGIGARASAGPRAPREQLATALSSGAVVLVTATAAFAVRRFLRTGSPLAPSGAPDPFAVAAPALSLVAFGFVVVLLAAPLTRGLTRLAARRPTLSPVLELRQVSRRITLHAVPVVLLVLATATGALAAGYAGTWTALRQTAAEVGAGADLRTDVDGGSADGAATPLSAAVSVEGVRAATGVIQAPLRVDGGRGQLTALPVAQTGVSSAPDSVMDPQALVGIRPRGDPLPGIDLPSDAVRLAASVSASAVVTDGNSRTIGLSVWLHDGVQLVHLDLGTLRLAPGGGQVMQTLTADLPPGSWRIVAVDSELSTTATRTLWDVALVDLVADGRPVAVDGAAWDPATLPAPGTSSRPYRPGEERISFEADLTARVVGERGRLPLRSTVQRSMPAPTQKSGVPVLVTPAFAELITPRGVDVLIDGAPVRLERAGEIGVVPGNAEPAAVLADAGALQAALLRAAPSVPDLSEVWVDIDPASTRTAAAVAADVGDALGGGPVAIRPDAASDPVSETVRVAYWIAALSAVLLASPAIVAAVLTQASTRRGEVAVMRAIGVGARAQARSRARELWGVQAVAVVIGTLAGWALCRLVMVDLVRSTMPQVPRSLPLATTVDLLAGGAFLAAVLLMVSGAALWLGALVRGQARDRSRREERA